MIRKLFTTSLVCLMVLCIQAAAFGQSVTVSGFIKDKSDNYPLLDANVLLLSLPDSALIEPITTDFNGKFIFNSVNKGNYVLKVLYVGYEDYILDISVSSEPVVVKTIELVAANTIGEVVITLKRSVTQNGDTVQYSADGFKTNPDASAEDLITKMPGITIQDGKVQAQGESVTKVLVDGKPFFGDDASVVLKNLQADVIDKIQVFDQLSDQSQFTGFNDGNTSKTINIVTKPDKRDGHFGKVYVGYGYDNKYKAGGNLNFFKGNRRISIIAQSNNINEQNFATEDLAGVSSGASRQNSRGGASNFNNGTSDFLVNTQGGVSKTNAFGINYSDKWGTKTDVSASYFFNRSDSKETTILSRTYIPFSDSSQVYNQSNNTNSINTNHRINARVDYKIDSSNSILIVPKISLQLNDGDRLLDGSTEKSLALINNTTNQYNSNLYAFNASNFLMYRHKFLKKGRTFSLGLTTAWTKNDGESYFLARNTYYTNQTLSDTLNQSSNLGKNGYNIAPRFSYTEPLSDKSLLEFNYDFSYALNESDKRTYNYNFNTLDYSDQDTVLSNSFNSVYITHALGTGYRYQTEKTQFSINGAYQQAELANAQQLPSQSELSKKYNSFLPSARLKVNFSKTKNLQLNYRTRTSSPSIDQLQRVLNNSNPLQVSTGNPELNQQYQHSLFTRYTSTNTFKSSSFFTLIGATYTQDFIANNTFIAPKDTVVNGIALSKGAQLISKENMDGYFTARSMASYGMPVAFIKSNINVNVFANYSRTPGIIQGVVNYANAPSIGGGIVLSSNISKSIDFTLSTNASYNYLRNTIKTNSNTNYYNQQSKAKLNVLFSKQIVFNTEATHQYYNGLTSNYNQNYILWNAGLGYKFLKQNAGEFRFTVFDILGQNNSVSRTFTDVYSEDMNTNVLTRYFMLTFSYTFRHYDKPDNKE